MSITHFMPTIWSESLYSQLDKQYIAVSNCNREFEGDIKNVGATVRICGVGDIAISDYKRDTDMSSPQALTDTYTTLYINRAKCFNFQIDDIDRAQAMPRLMEGAMHVAANSLANEADAYIYSLYGDAGKTVYNDEGTAENILDSIIEAKQRLYESNVTDASDIVIEVSPAIASLLFKAKAALSTDNTSMLEKGCIGNIAGCKVFVSNNIQFHDDEFHRRHKCLVRTKRAIAFAERLSEIEAYRPEKRFADAVKGLHLYGAKVVYPDELVLLDIGTELPEEEV